MAPYMSGEFLFSPVLSHCSKNLKRQTDWYYSSVLFGKQRKIHPRGMGAGWPQSKEKRSPQFSFGSSFYMFFFFPSSWACPVSIRLARRAVCFTWGSYSGPGTFLCSIFMGFSFLCLLAATILESFFLFYLSNRSIQKIPFVITFNIPNINILSKD